MQQSSEAMQQSSEAIQQSSEAIQQSSEARQQSSEARQQSPPIPENMGNLGKVLVVDDDALILNLLAIVLSRLGDSHEALEKVQNENFSLIISDVQMPNMDGFMLVKKIREIDKTTPIILMSGTNKLSIAECSKLSINYYIAKPLNIPIFYEILSSI
jgi:CheY-like chemotaxis protein